VPNLDLVTSSAEEHTDRKRKKYLIKKPSCKGAFAIVTDSNFEQRADVTRLDLLTTSKHLNNQTFNHHHHHHHHHRGLLSVSDAVSTISSYMQANHRKTSSRRQDSQITGTHAHTHAQTDGRVENIMPTSAAHRIGPGGIKQLWQSTDSEIRIGVPLSCYKVLGLSLPQWHN